MDGFGRAASINFDDASIGADLANEDFFDLDNCIDNYLLQMQGSQPFGSEHAWPWRLSHILSCIRVIELPDTGVTLRVELHCVVPTFGSGFARVLEAAARLCKPHHTSSRSSCTGYHSLAVTRARHTALPVCREWQPC